MLSFNWIDLVNQPTGPTVQGAQHRLIARIGNALYVLLNTYVPFGGTSTGQPLIYKSDNAGLTWTLLDQTYTGAIDYFLLASLTAYGSTLRTVNGAPQTGTNRGTLGFDVYTLGGGWLGTSGVGGGFPADARPAAISPVAFEFLRSDGTRIVVYSDKGSDNQIRVLKVDSGGTWTQLALIQESGGAFADYDLRGCHQHGDIIHGFASVRNYSPGTSRDLYHFSVSAGDVVSSLHLIEANVETTSSEPQSLGRCDVSANGNSLAFAYGYLVRTNSPNGVLHVAIGDISTNELNPSWEIEGPPSSQLRLIGPDIEAGITFKGTNTLSAYWFDGDYSAALSLVSSTRTTPGTWTATTTEYGPDSGFGNPGAFHGFDLLNAFTNGVGILIEIEDGSGLPKVGYTGPPLTQTGCRYYCT